MKKLITIFLFFIPFVTFAQGPWEFNTSGNTEGWSATQGSATTPATVFYVTSTNLHYETISGATAVSRNPTFRNATANMDGTTYNSIQISLKNGTAANYLRVYADGTFYTSAITTNDAEYKTYTFIMNKVGTIVSLYFEFKLQDVNAPTGSGNHYVPAAAGLAIDIDYIRPFTYVAPIRNVFDFNTSADLEGFSTLIRATAVQTTDGSDGVLRMTSTGVSALDSKVTLNSSKFTVDGTTNKYAHIRLKNTSKNTKFLLGGLYLPLQTYTTSDANYKTYDFDLSTWTGNQFPELAFGVQNTWSNAGTYAVGAVVISSNSYYVNITGANSPTTPTALTPKTDPTNWVLVGADASWSLSATYNVNDLVIYYNSGTSSYSTYKNLTGINTSTDPSSDNTNWVLVTPTEGSLLDITNSIYIDQIVFDNTAPVLSIKDIFINKTIKKKITSISLYPNPAQDFLNIEAQYPISKLEIFSLSGQKISEFENMNNINVLNLNKGTYLLKITLRYGDPEIIKFIKY
jgi:hypothetical protein